MLVKAPALAWLNNRIGGTRTTFLASVTCRPKGGRHQWPFTNFCRTLLWGQRRSAVSWLLRANAESSRSQGASDPITQMVAKIIIDIGKTGIEDPEQM